MRRAVFLDRDGVLNHTTVRGATPFPPQTADALELLPGVPEALGLLAARGLLLLVVTNQPDVARGSTTRAAVEAINARLVAMLPQLNAVYTCFHDTPDNCVCRKPRPGLLLQAAEAYTLDLPRSYLVGDRWSDVAAGQAVGCTTFLLDTAYNQRERCQPDYVVADLYAAAELIASAMDIPTSEGGPHDT